MKRLLFGFLVIFGIVFLLASCQFEGPFTITYHANALGTSGFTTDNNNYESGEVATVLDNNFTHGGHTFQHWNTSPGDSGTSYDPGDTITMTHSVTLYAIWNP